MGKEDSFSLYTILLNGSILDVTETVQFYWSFLVYISKVSCIQYDVCHQQNCPTNFNNKFQTDNYHSHLCFMPFLSTSLISSHWLLREMHKTCLFWVVVQLGDMEILNFLSLSPLSKKLCLSINLQFDRKKEGYMNEEIVFLFHQTGRRSNPLSNSSNNLGTILGTLI